MTAAADGRSYRFELVVLTAAKGVANTALRWVGPFLPTLERAFTTTTGTLTGIMGVSELAGLSTIATGPSLDRGNERRLYVIGLMLVGLSSIIALAGRVDTFAASFLLLVLGVSNLTAAGHAWIGHRVAFTARGRSIGVFETSWALALLVGAPIVAVLIEAFGWRGPYVALAIGSFVAAASVTVLVRPSAVPAPSIGLEAPVRRLPRTAWFPILASAMTAAAGIGTFVVIGSWLDDDYGVSTGGLGLIAAGFGAMELAASSSVATIGDRVGARRSVLFGLGGLLTGLAVMGLAGDSRAAAIAGVVVFLAGFEYGFVSSLTLVTEAAPASRGRAIGISNACGTVGRAGAVVASGQLYERFGIAGSITLASGAALVGIALAVATDITGTGR